jgi:hypothetical protein
MHGHEADEAIEILEKEAAKGEEADELLEELYAEKQTSRFS